MPLQNSSEQTEKKFSPKNFMRLPDGPGWSPDGGSYWVKGELLYWSDGSIWNMADGGMIRTMPGGCEHTNDYSSWSDEKRAIEQRKAKARRRRARQAANKRAAAINALRASARAKLTDAEVEACNIVDEPYE